MAEWFKALVLKTRDPEMDPGVRIPLLPKESDLFWRDGRVAEGGGLLNRYTAKSRIGGSNPPLSAISAVLLRVIKLLE